MNCRIFAPMMIAIALLGVFWGLAEYFGPRLLNIPSGSNDSSGSQGTANMNVTLLIDFGNGTKLWFNDTKVARTDNFYTVTYNDVRGNLEAVWNGYPINAHLVYKIMGYGCGSTSPGCNGYWSLWVWNASIGCWSYSEVGADLVSVQGVTMVAWYFADNDPHSFPGNCS